MKLNLILFVVLIICALTTVNFKHLTRNNFAELDVESKKTLDLKDQQTMLRIEESVSYTHLTLPTIYSV